MIMKKNEGFILASTLTGFGMGLFNGDARTQEVAKTDFLNRRSQRGVAATTYGRIGVSACRRGKAAFAREESSRKCAKFKVSTAEITKGVEVFSVLWALVFFP